MDMAVAQQRRPKLFINPVPTLFNPTQRLSSVELGTLLVVNIMALEANFFRERFDETATSLVGTRGGGGSPGELVFPARQTSSSGSSGGRSGNTGTAR